MKSPEHEKLGNAIRELRTARGVSQEDLAHDAGLHRNYLGGIERGEINTSLAILLRLARALDTSVSALAARAGL